MTVVVTGASGFLGCSLVAGLVARGEHVVAVDRVPTAERDGVLALTADLLDRDELVDTALGTADAVFHLAGCPGVRDDPAGPAATDARRQRDNVDATARVLAAVPYDVPLVVASSSSVYGGSRRGRPSREHDGLEPRGGYAASKIAVEALCAERLRRGGVVSVARPFTVVGEGQRPDMALSRWLADARAGEPLRVFGSLERTRDLTDVRDAARVFMALADHRFRGAVNVGTGQAHSLADMVAAVANAIGCDQRVVIVPAAPAEVSATRACTRRLRAAVGFVPHTDLPDVVARQLAAEGAVEVAA